MQTIVNLGTGGTDLNGQNGSTTSADSNDALFLDWPGDNAGNYVYLPGVSGNYLSVPDEAALDITGDIDVRAYVAMDDWTPAANEAFVSKYSAPGQQSFIFSLHTTGGLRFYWSEDGSTNISKIGSPVSIGDYEEIWVRATLDVDNGAGGNDLKFYTSTDGSSWSQVGSTITTAGTTSIYSGTANVNVGAISSGTGLEAKSKVYRAQILDGIDGTTVLDVDCSQISSGAATSFTALTGQTVTINRSTSGRKSVAVVSPVWLFGTDDYMEVADNALLDIPSDTNFTALVIVRTWDVPSNNQRYLAKFTNSTNDGWVVRNSSTNQQTFVGVGDGTFYGDSAISVSEGVLRSYGLVVNRDTNTLTAFVDDSLSSTPSDISSLGAVSSGSVLRVGRRADATGYADAEIFAAAVFRRALTATEIAAITSYYQARVS